MNPVVHFEFPGDDLERMKKFYTQAFGWKLDQMGSEMNDYVVAQTDETDEKGMLKKSNRINGGFYKRSPQAPTPSVVIAVDDINEGIKKIEAAGGKVAGEIVDIPGIGKYTSFTDTEGNHLSILQPNEQM